MTTLTEARTAQLPRVNLLPPEIAEAAQLRRLQILLGLLVLGAFVVAGLAFFWVSGQVGAAEDELTAAEAEGATLQTQIASFSKVPEVLGELDTAETNLTLAMAPEIRWSFYLNDLSLTIPRSVRLSGMTATNAASAAQVGGQTEATLTPLGQISIGTIEFQGMAEGYDPVASWLQSLMGQNGYVEPTVSSIAQEGEGEATAGDVFNYTTSTHLTPDALSMRFEDVMTAGE